MFKELEEINARPAPFQCYTADELWTDEHTSMKMLEYHLDDSIDLSSRKTTFIDQSVNWIVSHFGVDANTRIADFGCGPGLYTTRFAENQADVTGIDFSKRSIRFARETADRKGLDITYHLADYLAFETGKRFDLITMIFCDYCALSPDQRKVLLKKFHTFLKPGGAILLDVHSINTFDGKREMAVYEPNQLDHFWSSNRYYGFLNTFKYDREKITCDKYTIIEKGRTRVLYNWLQYFSPESLERELEENGFKVKGFFSDVAGAVFTPESPDIAVAANKI